MTIEHQYPTELLPFLHNLPVGIVLLQNNRTVIFANAAATDLLGVKPGAGFCHQLQEAGLNITATNHNTIEADDLCNWIFDQPSATTKEIFIHAKDKEPVWLRMDKQLAQPGQTHCGLVLLSLSALLKKEEKNSEEEVPLQLFLDNRDEALAILDRDFKIIKYNKVAEENFLLIHKGKLAPQRCIFDVLQDGDKERLRPLFTDALRGQKTELRRQHVLDDGTLKVFLNILRPLYKNGLVAGLIVHSKDVTEAFQTEEALQQSNERFQRAAQASYDVVWEHDLVTGNLLLSENFASILGYEGSFSSLSAKEFSARFAHPHDWENVVKAVRTFLKSKKKHFDYPLHRLRKKDGTSIYVQAKAIASRDAQGNAYRLTGVTRDITAAHLMEQQLRESNERFTLAAKASFDLVFEANYNTGTIFYNDVITSLYEYEPGELSHLSQLKTFVHPDDLLLFEKELHSADKAGLDAIHLPLLRLRKKHGGIVFTEIRALLIRDAAGKAVRRIGKARDITWRYLMEQQLRKSNERFELATNASLDLIWERDFSENSFFYNDTFTTVYGYSEEQMQNPDKVFAEFPHPDDREWLLKLVTDFLTGRETHLSYPVHRLLKADSSVVYVEANALLLRNADASPQRMVGVSRDITDRYLMEQKLRESNGRFTRASKAAFDIIWEADLKTNTIYFNEAFYQMLGYDEGQTFTAADFFGALLHPADRAFMQEKSGAFLAGQECFVRFPVHRLLKKDGSCIYVESNALASRDKNGAAYLLTGVTHDVTIHRLNEMALQELNKQVNMRAAELEASNNELERFAYVASHDLQEPLRMVSSFMSLLKKKYDAVLDDTGRQYIHFAVDGAERMKKLILDLLQFSRIGTHKGKQEPVDLNLTVQQLLTEFTFATQEKNATINAAPLPVVIARKTQLGQVFQNLIGNALKYNKAPAPLIEIGYTEQAEAYTFFVRDNGIGIDPKYFEKIFVIFQQLHSKNEYSGTGIGLAITKKIVEQHNGRLWVESAPGAGSTFYFTLPKTETNAHDN